MRMVATTKIAGIAVALFLSPHALGQSLPDEFVALSNPGLPTDSVDRRPITRNYSKDQYSSVSVYRVLNGQSRGLVVMLEDNDLYGNSRSFAQSRFVQRLLDDGIAVAYISARPAHRFGMTTAAQGFANGIAYILSQPDKFRVNGPLMIVGIGVGAAHAGLLGTNPALLETAGLNFDMLRGVVLINSTALDGTEAVVAAPARYRERYLKAYGEDRAAQQLSSMAGHIGGKNAPHFYVLNENRRENWGSEALPVLEKLKAVNGNVVFDAMPEQFPSAELPKSSRFGDKDHAPSMRLLAFIEERLASK